MDRTTDECQLTRVAQGDREAFALVYDRYAECIMGILLPMLGSRSDAEDVLQDTFWQVWTRAHRYDPARGRPLTWLVLLARSRAVDFLRRRKRSPLPDLEAVAEPVAPANGHARDEEARFALAALDGLAEAEQEAIRLSFFRGLTHEQIADLTARPLGTVKTNIRRGLLKLKRSLNGDAK